MRQVIVSQVAPREDRIDEGESGFGTVTHRHRAIQAAPGNGAGPLVFFCHGLISIACGIGSVEGRTRV